MIKRTKQQYFLPDRGDHFKHCLCDWKQVIAAVIETITIGTAFWKNIYNGLKWNMKHPQ